MKQGSLTDDEKACRKILIEIKNNGYPLSGGMCLDWLVNMDILRPPETGRKWKFGKEYPRFKKYINKNFFGDDI
jgi:hypothetical protein